MSSERKEIILSVPADLTKKCKGLALDIGGSVVKFIFRTKEDVEKATADENKFSCLHLVTFPRSSLEDGLEYIKKKAYFRTEMEKENTQEIYTTGMGCTEFGKLINDTLNVRLTNLTEFDCFVKSFVYLAKHLPRSELLEKHDAQVFAQTLQFAEEYAHVMVTILPKNQAPSAEDVLQNARLRIGRPAADGVEPPSEKPLAEAESDIFPCLLLTCGSGFMFLKVEKDGTFQVTDGSLRSGTPFVGIGRLLTGAKTFDELMELASRGEQHNVDRFMKDYTRGTRAADDDKSMYTSWLDEKLDLDLILFHFGKAASAGHDAAFRPEDIARSWLNFVVVDLVQTVQMTCTIQGVKRVFFCGGFCAHELVRFFITQEMGRRNIWSSVLSRDACSVTFDFVKPGQHLGALGCILNGLE